MTTQFVADESLQYVAKWGTQYATVKDSALTGAINKSTDTKKSASAKRPKDMRHIWILHL